MGIDFGRVRLEDVWETLEDILRVLFADATTIGGKPACPFCDRTDSHRDECPFQGLWSDAERDENGLTTLTAQIRARDPDWRP